MDNLTLKSLFNPLVLLFLVLCTSCNKENSGLKSNRNPSKKVLLKDWDLENNLYGYVNENNELVISHQYQDAKDFQKGIGVVKKNDRWFLIDKNNKKVSREFTSIGNFHNNYAIATYQVEKRSFHCIIKNNGKIIAQKLPVVEYKEGIFLAIQEKDSQKQYAVINTQSGQLSAYYQNINIHFKIKNRALIASEGPFGKEKYFLLDSIGNIISGKYDFMLPHDDLDGFDVQIDNKNDSFNKNGFINLNGKLIVPCKYHKLKKRGNLIEALSSKKTTPSYGLYHISGKKLTPDTYRIVSLFTNSKLILISQNNKEYSYYKYIPEIKDIKRVSEIFQYKFIRTDYKYYKILQKRFSMGNKVYYMGSFYRDGMCLVTKKGKFGFINEEGKLIIKTIYDESDNYFENGSVIMKKGTKSYELNKEGKVIRTF